MTRPLNDRLIDCLLHPLPCSGGELGGSFPLVTCGPWSNLIRTESGTRCWRTRIMSCSCMKTQTAPSTADLPSTVSTLCLFAPGRDQISSYIELVGPCESNFHHLQTSPPQSASTAMHKGDTGPAGVGGNLSPMSPMMMSPGGGKNRLRGKHARKMLQVGDPDPCVSS